MTSARPPQLTALPLPFQCALDGDWARAAAAWDALDCPYEAAFALLDGDETALREALTTFERLGARAAAAIVIQRLRQLGARAIPRGPRPTTRANPANLTAREVDVLALMMEGRRNAEIADRLFLSPKTIEHHVSAILAKLGATSRAEAIARAQAFDVSPK
jgi:DNA-binding NarL/FixJ family response regulator